MDAGALEQEGLAAAAAAVSTDAIEAVRIEYLGRKSALKQALREVRDRETGMTLNALRERVESAVAAKQQALETAELERIYAESAVDVTLPGDRVARGRLHLLTQIKREIEDIFLGMGYEVFEGPEVVTVWQNFDALTTDRGHPSRSPNDTFYLTDDVLLRTHTSP